jgi:hypothetical protein
MERHSRLLIDPSMLHIGTVLHVRLSTLVLGKRALASPIMTRLILANRNTVLSTDAGLTVQ